MKVNFFTNTYNTTFAGRDDVRRKTNAFSNELFQKASWEYMSLKKIKQLVNSHIPELDIKTEPANSKAFKNFGGSLEKDIHYSGNPLKAEAKLCMHLKNRDLRSINDYYEYLCTVAHEMSHAFNAQDKDIGIVNFTTKELSNITDRKQWIRNADAALIVFNTIEEAIIDPIINAHLRVKDSTENTSPFTIQVRHDRLKKFLDSIFTKIKKSQPDINVDFIKKVSYLQAMDEFDAYMTDERLKEKLFDDQNYKRDNFIPYLYLCLAKCLDVTGVE